MVACRLTRDGEGARLAETQTFGTTTSDLLRLPGWLAEGGRTLVGLERTREFWKPVFHLREGAFAVWLPECLAQQSRAWPQDRHQGNGVDC